MKSFATIAIAATASAIKLAIMEGGEGEAGCFHNSAKALFDSLDSDGSGLEHHEFMQLVDLGIMQG